MAESTIHDAAAHCVDDPDDGTRLGEPIALPALFYPSGSFRLLMDWLLYRTAL